MQKTVLISGLLFLALVALGIWKILQIEVHEVKPLERPSGLAKDSHEGHEHFHGESSAQNSGNHGNVIEYVPGEIQARSDERENRQSPGKTLIRGRVYDAEGIPVAGAAIFLASMSKPAASENTARVSYGTMPRAFSGLKGEYSLDVLPGVHTPRATAELEDRTRVGQGETVHLAEGAVAEVDITVGGRVMIRGRVCGTAGDGKPNYLMVITAPAGRPAGSISVLTRYDGTFAVEGLDETSEEFLVAVASVNSLEEAVPRSILQSWTLPYEFQIKSRKPEDPATLSEIKVRFDYQGEIQNDMNVWIHVLTNGQRSSVPAHHVLVSGQNEIPVYTDTRTDLQLEFAITHRKLGIARCVLRQTEPNTYFGVVEPWTAWRTTRFRLPPLRDGQYTLRVLDGPAYDADVLFDTAISATGEVVLDQIPGDRDVYLRIFGPGQAAYRVRLVDGSAADVVHLPRGVEELGHLSLELFDDKK